MFASFNRCLRETGTFAVNRQSAGWGQSICALQFDEDVLQHFEKDPSTSNHMFDHVVSVNCRLLWNVVCG